MSLSPQRLSVLDQTCRRTEMPGAKLAFGGVAGPLDTASGTRISTIYQHSQMTGFLPSIKIDRGSIAIRNQCPAPQRLRCVRLTTLAEIVACAG
jgi:hypothetical protein